ncbi:hypothetical protein MAR_005042 [Mya arenaria]|uniref:Uncharacterized protein n=1 Tax=Mya arenaria TaxID=6604 RepID=A0ABY7F1H6_MYAAR|nr:hypothetical protein MAR_005042 [Mya arenaria]
MENAKTQVCLQQMATMPSYKKPGNFDLKYTYQSKITKPSRKLNFTSQPPEDVGKKMTLNVVKEAPVWEKVHVVAKVVQVSTPVKVSEKLTKMTIRIADETDSKHLAIWNEDIEKVAIGRTNRRN